MMVRRYVVKEMPEAVLQIRKELGKDAVILSTKRVTVKKWLGFWRQHRIEVLAAIGDDVPLAASVAGKKRAQMKTKESATPGTARDVQGTAAVSESSFQAWVDDTAYPTVEPDIPQSVAMTQGHDAQSVLGVTPKTEDELASLRVELQAVRQLIENTVVPVSPAIQSNHMPGLASETMVGALIDKGFSSTAAKRLVEETLEVNAEAVGTGVDGESHFGSAMIDTIYKELQSNISPSPLGLETRMVALIGATGVGKTTTVAKLAALNVLAGRKVGLITLDTFRIAAIEQLRTYANILNVPLEVVYQLEEISGALGRLSHCDIIFVDTAGRNYRSAESVNQVKTFLEALSVDEVIMVMSVTSKIEDMHRLARQFQEVPVAKFLFTKLDETDLHGSIIEMMLTYQKPLCFVTNGQNVPDDIEIASIEKIVHGVLGGGN